MDNPSGANNSDINQQLSSMSAPIVSTLTTATPITSEIVSDFEPDPKFEITPLEMASYDCSDVYSTNLLEEQHQQPLVENDNVAVTLKETTHAEHLHHVENVSVPNEEVKAQTNLSQYRATNTLSHIEDVDTKTTQQTSLKTDEKLTPKKQTQTICQSELVGGDITSNPTVVGPETSIVPGRIEPSALDVLGAQADLAQMEKVETEKKNEESNDLHQLDFGLSADISSAVDQTIKNSDSNLDSMTQSSVDAQMEKVIDNIVELGGVHQSLGHPEGKEELLASIRREITSDRGSIDLIADVASRQQSIEIIPDIASQQYSRFDNRNVIGSKTEEVDTGRIKVYGTHEKIVEEPINEKTSNEDNFTVIAAEETVVEEKIEEKIEEILDEKTVEASATKNVAVTAEKVIEEKVSDMIAVEEHGIEMETFNTDVLEQEAEKKTQIDNHPKQDNLERGIQLKEPDVVATEVVANHLEMESEKPPQSKVEGEHDKIEKVLKEKPTVRKERHAAKKTVEPETEERMTRPRRATRAKKDEEKIEEKVVEKVVEKIEEKVEEKIPDGLHGKRLRPNPPTEEQPKSDLIASSDHPAEHSNDLPLDDVSSTPKKSAESSVPEQARQSRSLRPRSSLKRAYDDDDDSPKKTSLKAEPPKKQSKKARGGVNEHPPLIKLPSYRSRTTISSSDPISRLDKKYESNPTPTIKDVQPEVEKKFMCHQCGFATDRLNNLVYHSTKSYCQGKLQMGEVMKADIIRQQQQSKNKRRSVR